MAKNLKEQAEELARQMAENLTRNDQNRDAVDEADFRRSLGAEPFSPRKKKGPSSTPSPFRDKTGS